MFYSSSSFNYSLICCSLYGIRTAMDTRILALLKYHPYKKMEKYGLR